MASLELGGKVEAGNEGVQARADGQRVAERATPWAFGLLTLEKNDGLRCARPSLMKTAGHLLSGDFKMDKSLTSWIAVLEPVATGEYSALFDAR